MSIRVVIADDHEAIRAGLRLMLDGDGIEVVGEAADGAEAVRVTRRTRPDVVLMDIRMPGVDGIEATRQITGENLADVLVLTTFCLDETVRAAVQAGAVGFLLKSTSSADLVAAVTRVAAGEGVLAPEITRALLGALAGSAPSASPHPAISTLTAREVDVLAALGRGLSNAAIAESLFITEATTKTHVSRVLAKLGCGSRMEAAVIARDAGLD